MRLKLPLLPTTAVGSFPKPPALIEARRKGIKEKIKRLEREATEKWIHLQERLGLDVLVDGEFYRGDMVAFFAEHLKGFKMGGLVRSYGNRYYRKPVIVGEVGYKGPITVKWWKFAQSLTEKPVKGIITGPYTMMDWSFNEYYPDRKQACLSLAKALRKEVENLYKAGARIIQIDEPALSARPEELPLANGALKIITQGIDAYFIVHICYGAFEYIYPQMLQLPVHNFDLEMSNSDLDLVELFRRHPFTKDLSFGVIDVHSHIIETVEQVKERIEKALGVLNPKQLWIDPDCGLKTRTEEEAIAKLEVMVRATREIRQTLT
jgi:5-methyltetrahydropteroyltriglutamate--homocysteine methyltransferase